MPNNQQLVLSINTTVVSMLQYRNKIVTSNKTRSILLQHGWILHYDIYIKLDSQSSFNFINLSIPNTINYHISKIYHQNLTISIHKNLGISA